MRLSILRAFFLSLIQAESLRNPHRNSSRRLISFELFLFWLQNTSKSISAFSGTARARALQACLWACNNALDCQQCNLFCNCYYSATKEDRIGCKFIFTNLTVKYLKSDYINVFTILVNPPLCFQFSIYRKYTNNNNKKNKKKTIPENSAMHLYTDQLDCCSAPGLGL